MSQALGHRKELSRQCCFDPKARSQVSHQSEVTLALPTYLQLSLQSLTAQRQGTYSLSYPQDTKKSFWVD